MSQCRLGIHPYLTEVPKVVKRDPSPLKAQDFFSDISKAKEEFESEAVELHFI